MAETNPIKAYRVDFSFTVEDKASMYVIAADEASAKEGCMSMLKKNQHIYSSPEILAVEEYNNTPDQPATAFN